MSRSASVEAWRRRVQGWRAAERRELDDRRERGPLAPDESLAAAIELAELLPFSAEDAVRTREVEQARRAWSKLHAYFACPPKHAKR